MQETRITVAISFATSSDFARRATSYYGDCAEGALEPALRDVRDLGICGFTFHFEIGKSIHCILRWQDNEP